MLTYLTGIVYNDFIKFLALKDGKFMSKGKKTLIITLSVILGIILILVSAYFAFYYSGKNKFHRSDKNIENSKISEVDNDPSLIEYQGKKYKLNENIISILFIGIDKENLSSNLGYGKNGQADCLFIMTIDTSDKSIDIIPVSRETMADVNIYADSGNFGGTQKEQICLSYAYGNSPESCSENVLRSVKRAMYGINISSYVTVDLKCIEKVVDSIGGVELVPIETIKTDNSGTIYEGKSTKLNGKKSVAYIRSRDDDIEANSRRMERQKQFLTAFASKLGNTILSNPSKLTSFYNNMKTYYYTNIDFSQVTYLASNFLAGNIGNSFKFHKIEGTLQKGEKWIEFIPNEESVLENIINVFYIEKK